jgi:hypothetical protein
MNAAFWSFGTAGTHLPNSSQFVGNPAARMVSTRAFTRSRKCERQVKILATSTPTIASKSTKTAIPTANARPCQLRVVDEALFIYHHPHFFEKSS